MLIDPKEAATVATAAAAAAPRREKLRLGDVLVQQQLISQEQLQQALELQRGRPARRLGRLLIEAGVDHRGGGCARAGPPAARAGGQPQELPAPKSETVRLLSESPARRHRAIVLEDKGEHLLVGFVDPLDLAAYDEVARILKRDIDIAVVPESQLLETGAVRPGLPAAPKRSAAWPRS
jgi:MSHA biogenesis protein MshE